MKIAGMLVVGTDSVNRYLKRTIKRLESLCDVIVVGCNARDKATQQYLANHPLIKAYDFIDREWGKEQWKIKEELVRYCLAKENPDWVICVDDDEILDKKFTRDKAEELADRGEIAYTFYCVHLWDKEDQMRVDGHWFGFRNVRYYKFIPEAGLSFKKTALHCGLAPLYAYNWCADSEFHFKHLGYLKPEHRKKKIARYKKYDPQGQYISKEYYNSIPEQPKLQKFDEDKFCLQYNPKKPNKSKYIKQMKEEKTYYIKNKHGKVFGVKESMLEEHAKRPGIEILSEATESKAKEKDIKIIKPEDKEETETEEENVCSICGFEAKSKAGLAVHKRAKHS